MAARSWTFRSAGPALRRLGQAVHNDQGTVAVTFLFALPILLTIVSMIVQAALVVNAQVGVYHAAFLTARSAMTCLPDQEPQRVASAAYLSLVPLSPQAIDTVTSEASAMHQALLQAGAPVTETFPARYTYAQDATTVDYPHANDVDYYLTHRGQSIEVTVTYRFYLTVPIAHMLLGRTDRVGGIDGRFITLQATCPVQTAHGRQAQSNGDGWPQ